MGSRMVIVWAVWAGLFLGAERVEAEGGEGTGFLSQAFDQVIVEWDTLSGMGARQGGIIVFDYVRPEPALVIGIIDNDQQYDPFAPVGDIVSRAAVGERLYPGSVVDLFAWEGFLSALRKEDLRYVQQIVTDRFWGVTFYFVRGEEVVIREEHNGTGEPLFIADYLIIVAQRGLITTAAVK